MAGSSSSTAIPPFLEGDGATHTGRPSLADALSAQQDKLLACVHCGFCLPVCPTYTRLGDEGDSPRGRLYLMRAVVEGRLDPGADAFQMHIDRCLGCRACETVCPSGVEYGSLLEMARFEAATARRPPMTTRLMLSVFASKPATRVLLALALLLRLTGLPALGARLLPRRKPFGSLKLAAAMLASTQPWARRRAGKQRRGEGKEGEVPGPPAPVVNAGAVLPSRSALLATQTSPDASAKTAALLEGCVQKSLFRRVHASTARVLGANGLQMVRVEHQVCCGALHAHGGDIETARVLARRNVDAFDSAELDLIVVNAAGCGAAMKEYGHWLASDPAYAERARAFSARVRDVSELLGNMGIRRGAPLPMVATYDAPCHLLHAQRVAHAPRSVLGAVPELTLRPLDGEDECCGGAGIYGITHPQLGGRIGSDKAAAVRRTGAELVITGNPGCAMQIGAWLRMDGSPVPTAHPVEVLDESYRRAGYYSRGSV